jgi:N-acetylmuramoyl-L-alanine amidase
VQGVYNLNSLWKAGVVVTASSLLLGQSWVSAESIPKGSCPRGNLTIGVDIGHSVVKYGARSARGRHEFLFNQRFVNELSTYGDDNHLKFVVLNPRGQDLTLRDRPRLAVAKGADIFISIHHDAVNDKYLQAWTFEGRPEKFSDKFEGYSIFISPDGEERRSSLRLATLVGQQFKAIGRNPTLHHAEPIKGEGRKLINERLGIYEAPFGVLVSSPLPSVLVEIGVIVNRSEEESLNDQRFRKKVERALLAALAGYCSSAPS